MKTCTKCGEEKPLDQFYNHKRSKDGKRSNCTPCRRAYKAIRRLNLSIATPLWFEKEAVKKLYSQSGAGMQVDHVITLNNPDVCGLNCFDNLQILTARANNKKNNTFDQDAESARQLQLSRGY